MTPSTQKLFLNGLPSSCTRLLNMGQSAAALYFDFALQTWSMVSKARQPISLTGAERVARLLELQTGLITTTIDDSARLAILTSWIQSGSPERIKTRLSTSSLLLVTTTPPPLWQVNYLT